MEEMAVLEELFDKKIISILKLFFRESDRELYLQEVSQKASVPMATVSRILHNLERLQIIQVKKISRFKLYSLKQNEKTRFLETLFREDRRIVERFTEKAKGIKGVDEVILHGKESADRANILLIGDDIDAGEVKALCAEIREKYGFVISSLSLAREQYEQMSQMGLYSGQKKVLYQKGQAR